MKLNRFFIILFFSTRLIGQKNVLEGWVVIPADKQVVASIEQEATEEYQAVQQAIRDQEKAIARADKPAWNAFKDAMKAIPKGIGLVGDVLRVLSRSQYYLDTTLRTILQEEEKKLSTTDQQTLKHVREHIQHLDTLYTARLEKEAYSIKDSVKQRATIEAIQLEYLAALHYLSRLDQPNPFGKISRHAQLLLLLSQVRDIRVLKAMAAQKLSTERAAQVWQDIAMVAHDNAIRRLRRFVSNPLFVAREQFVMNLVPELYNEQGANPYQNKDAVVRQRPLGSIHTEEKYTFLAARLGNVVKALQKIFSLFAPENQLPKVTAENALRIGLVFSGGGYRAMILTAGYMQALEQLGLLDAVLYISTLSGSTWWLAPWLLSGTSVEVFNQNIANNIDQMNVQQLALQAPKEQDAVDRFHRKIVLPKFAFDQPLSTVDIYGALLSQVLLDGSYAEYVSEQWDLVKDGNKPFPIYTTISMHAIGQEPNKTYRYNWYEINPLEVENIDLGLAIPSWSFGRSFARGMSQRTVDVPTYPYEQSLGFLLGIFGSAYAIDFLKEAHKFVHGAAQALMQAVVRIVRLRRLWPAQVPNPWFELPDFITKRLFTNLDQADWLRTKKLLTFVDAGIDFNLPVLPLLKKDRALDVIIIGDASAGAQKMQELHGKQFPKELAKFFKRLDPQALHYTPHPEYNTAPFIVYTPTKPGLPFLIYINFQKDDAAVQNALASHNAPVVRNLATQYSLATFDPIACITAGHCSTFNFRYTRPEFEQLKALGQFNVLSNATKLIKVLLEIYGKKA